jgi:hypothetical protein
MITASDSFTTYETGNYYAILPQVPVWELTEYVSHFNTRLVPAGFHYHSGSNTDWLTVAQIRNQIRQHLDHEFQWEGF